MLWVLLTRMPSAEVVSTDMEETTVDGVGGTIKLGKVPGCKVVVLEFTWGLVTTVTRGNGMGDLKFFLSQHNGSGSAILSRMAVDHMICNLG